MVLKAEKKGSCIELETAYWTLGPPSLSPLFRPFAHDTPGPLFDMDKNSETRKWTVACPYCSSSP